jgi:hypothetical protein
LKDVLCFSEHCITIPAKIKLENIIFCLAQLKLRHFASPNGAFLTTNSFGNEPNDLLLRDTEMHFRELRKKTVTSYVEQSTLVSQSAGKSVTRKMFQLLDLKAYSQNKDINSFLPLEDNDKDLVQSISWPQFSGFT